jgi:hypothetical protein
VWRVMVDVKTFGGSGCSVSLAIGGRLFLIMGKRDAVLTLLNMAFHFIYDTV